MERNCETCGYKNLLIADRICRECISNRNRPSWIPDIDITIRPVVNQSSNTIKRVIFNPPATIVFWGDGTKTVVKCRKDEKFDPEKGLAMAISKHMLGDKDMFYRDIKKWIPEELEVDFNEIAPSNDGDIFYPVWFLAESFRGEPLYIAKQLSKYDLYPVDKSCIYNCMISQSDLIRYLHDLCKRKYD